jgi:hypothetical protein
MFVTIVLPIWLAIILLISLIILLIQLVLLTIGSPYDVKDLSVWLIGIVTKSILWVSHKCLSTKAIAKIVVSESQFWKRELINWKKFFLKAKENEIETVIISGLLPKPNFVTCVPINSSLVEKHYNEYIRHLSFYMRRSVGSYEQLNTENLNQKEFLLKYEKIFFNREIFFLINNKEWEQLSNLMISDKDILRLTFENLKNIGNEGYSRIFLSQFLKDRKLDKSIFIEYAEVTMSSFEFVDKKKNIWADLRRNSDNKDIRVLKKLYNI